MSNIASILAHDFNEISQTLNLDDASLKRILAPENGREM
jgi:hypothetical protein